MNNPTKDVLSLAGRHGVVHGAARLVGTESLGGPHGVVGYSLVF
jgi:hypothetical protein